MEAILRDQKLVSVLVDLSDAIAIDSTSLGVLAKLSMAVQRERNKLPTLVCSSPDIIRILENMSFDDIFAIVDNHYAASQNLAELPMANDLDENTVRERVIDAHRVLMSLNDNNHAAFKDLVQALEAKGQGSQRPGDNAICAS